MLAERQASFEEALAQLEGRAEWGVKVTADRNRVAQTARRVWHEMAEFDTSGAGVHPSWPDRFFATIVDDHLAASGNRG